MTAITTQKLRADGHQPHDIARMVTAGELQRIRRGAYCQEPAPSPADQHRLLIEGTVPQLRPDSVISHMSAAVLHELPVPANLLSRVTVTRPRNGSGGGNVTPLLHTYAGRVDPQQIELIDGVPTTSRAQTAADMARLLSRRDAIILLDAALHHPRGGEIAGMRQLIDEQLVIDRSRHHAARARIWLGEASGLAESPLETISRLAAIDGGVPKPVLQFELRDSSGRLIARFDFGWPEVRLGGEADGRMKYDQLLRPGESPVDAVMREKARENEIFAMGWGIVRWGMPEALAGAPLARRLNTVIAARRAELWGGSGAA